MIILGVAPPVVDPPPVDAPPPPPPVDVHSLSVRWTSWDGRYWDVTQVDSPVFLMSWLEGLGPVDPEHWWQDSPSIDGGSWDGSRIPRGPVSWELLAVSDGSTGDFMIEHARFIKSLNPRQNGVIRVTHPDGSWLEKVCRYESGANTAFPIDPVFSRNVRYVISWSTADPYWSGEPVTAGPFVFNAGGDFFPGPPFTLAPSQVLGAAAVDNPGDVDAFPLWHIDGPMTGFTVGVGSSVVTSTLTLTAGHWVEIDMRPERLTVLDDDGNDRWATLTDARFSSIPPGTSDLATTINGASAGSQVTLSFTPRYEGAF